MAPVTSKQLSLREVWVLLSDTQLHPGDSGDHPRALFSALGGRAGPSPVPGGEAEAPACPPEMSLCGSPGCTRDPSSLCVPVPSGHLLLETRTEGVGDSCVQSGSSDSLQAAPCIALHHHPAGSDHHRGRPPDSAGHAHSPGPLGPTSVVFIQLPPLGMGKQECPAAAQLPARLLTRLGWTGAGWGAQSICLPPETQGPLSNDCHLPLAVVLSARCSPAVLTVISRAP